MRTCLLVLLLSAMFQGDLRGRVVGISDGDTFTLLTEGNVQVKIRLHGIDAPEKGQDFGKRAKQSLSDLIYGRNVTVIDKGKDRYGRTIGMVFLGDANINEEMIRKGMAWHYLKYDKNPKWDELEHSAREAHAGLWSQAAPVAPWEWRTARRAGHADPNR